MDLIAPKTKIVINLPTVVQKKSVFLGVFVMKDKNNSKIIVITLLNAFLDVVLNHQPIILTHLLTLQSVVIFISVLNFLIVFNLVTKTVIVLSHNAVHLIYVCHQVLVVMAKNLSMIIVMWVLNV